MKKQLCIFVVFLLLISCSSYATSENNSYKGYSFNASFHVNDHKSNDNRNTIMKGLAGLLNILEIKGTLSIASEGVPFCMNLNFIPNEKITATVPFEISGKPSRLYVTSPIFGDHVLTFQNGALLEFTVKAHEHLGISLQRIALLLPYVHESALHSISQPLAKVIRTVSKSGIISKEDIDSLSALWTDLLDKDRELRYWAEAIGMENGLDEILKSEIEELPNYLTIITKGNHIQINKNENTESWICGSDILFLRKEDSDHISEQLSLPASPLGHIPVYSFDSHTSGQTTDIQLSTGIKNHESETYAILLNVKAEALPVHLEEAFESVIRLSLSGDNFSQISFIINISKKQNGSFTICVKGPADFSGSYTDLFEIVGIIAEDPSVTAPVMHEDTDFPTLTNLLSIDENRLSDFIGNITKPFIKHMLPFLAEIPVSGFQNLMDILTDSGILSVILN